MVQILAVSDSRRQECRRLRSLWWCRESVALGFAIGANLVLRPPPRSGRLVAATEVVEVLWKCMNRVLAEAG